MDQNQSEPERLVFHDVTQEALGIGTTIRPPSCEIEPSIGLYLSDNDLPKALELAEEMERVGQMPEVHLEESDVGSKIFIMFRIQNANHQFIRRFLSPYPVPELAPDCDVVMCFTCVLEEWGKTREFMEAFRRTGTFLLHLLDSEEAIVWGAELEYLDPEYPCLFDEESHVEVEPHPTKEKLGGGS